MGVFRFKRFEVRNELSPLKVNTDGVLLGAAVRVDISIRRVIDVGTGTGAIALMLAQRLSDLGAGFSILGIDIDGASAAEAGENFASSPWKANLTAEHKALSELEGTSEKFDLIISNPPYFDNSLRNPDERKTTARHTSENGLSYRSLVVFAAETLSEDGRLAMILPFSLKSDLLRYAAGFGLYPSRIMEIRPTEKKAPSRLIAEFTKRRSEVSCESLTIYNNGAASEEYRSITKNFYINQ